MSSTNEEKESAPSSPTSSSSPPAPPSPSRSSKRNRERDDSSKAKERSRRASNRPAAVPGAVPSSANRTERKKDRSSSSKRTSSNTSATKSGDRKSRSSSSAASKPGAISSTARESVKGSSRSSKSHHHRTSSKASPSNVSPNRSSRPMSEEKRNLLMRETSDLNHSAEANVASTNKMESGIVAEAVDDTVAETTSNALRQMNQQVEELRLELQRTREAQSRHRKIPLWAKVCLLVSLVVIAGAVGAVIALTGAGDGADEAAIPTVMDPTDSPTVSSDGQTVFDPPNTSTCSKIAEGLPVDGQQDMSVEPMLVTLNVNLVGDIDSDLWLAGLMQNIQQLVMPSIAGCGNTTLSVFAVGNAQADRDNVRLTECDDQQTNEPCYTVEFLVNLFVKEEALQTNDAEELGQLAEGIFQNSTSLVVDAQDENSTAIKDIGAVTSVPVTPSPSNQPSMHPVVTSESPSTPPSLRPSPPLPSMFPAAPPIKSGTGPSMAPVIGPTLAPTSTPSLGPSLSPTTAPPTLAPIPGSTTAPSPLPTPRPSDPPTPLPSPLPSPLPTPGPTIAPTPGPTESPSRAPSATPTLQPSSAPTFGPTKSPSSAPTTIPSVHPSSAPTTECMKLESILSKFAPFDAGNKAQALTWLCSDTWEPPADATDATALWEERFALAVFYYATSGDGWINNNGWLSSADVCSWSHITGCNDDGLVTKLEPYTNRNTGSIPSELWALTELKFLGLWENFLTGTLPSGIAAVTELTTLSVSYNDLTGTLPDEFGVMTMLTWLSVQENFFEGTIPPLPSTLTNHCYLALEKTGNAFRDRKLEGNCFTDTTNAPGSCRLSANCS